MVTIMWIIQWPYKVKLSKTLGGVKIQISDHLKEIKSKLKVCNVENQLSHQVQEI